MQKTVAIVHTSFALVEVLGKLAKEILPEVRCVNIVDDSLLFDVMRKGKVDNRVTRRMCSYFLAAEEMQAQVALNACSTVGETVDVARSLVSIPIVKIDKPMAKLAIKNGRSIGIIATVPTTIGPTSRLIERKAKEIEKEVNIKSWLCKGAFELLMAGEIEKHDNMVMQCIQEAARQMDIVVLAQATMARLVPQLDRGLREKVLSSPRGGMEEVKNILEKI